jgi:DNA-binding transcriptional ArsR family regulator
MPAVPFGVLAEVHRRSILDQLRDSERSVGELVGVLGLSQPAVSKHLRVLRDAGLVSEERAGRLRHYRLEAAPLAQVHDWLSPYVDLTARQGPRRMSTIAARSRPPAAAGGQLRRS